METGYVFCFVNVATLAALIHFGYRRVFPWFVDFMAVSALQSMVVLLIPADAPVYRFQEYFHLTAGLNRHVWAPVEMLLLLCTVAVMVEAIWKRLEMLSSITRFWFLFGLWLASFSGVMYLRSCDPVPPADWFRQFQTERVWFFMWMALLGFVGVWFSLLKLSKQSGNESSSAVRWHLIILALLMIMHWSALNVPEILRVVMRVFPRMHVPSDWSDINIDYRIVEMLACTAWIANAFHLQNVLEQLRQFDLLSDRLRRAFPPERRPESPHFE
jgi:hypothetical protein